MEHDIVKLEIEKILAPLQDQWAYPQLTRGIFDVNLSSLIKALILKDKAPPILIANSIRHAEVPPELLLEECKTQAREAMTEIIKDPKAYINKISDITRLSPSNDKKRKKATGILFHAGNSTQSWGNSLEYALRWGYDYNKISGEALNSKLGAVFEVENTQEINLKGRLGEIVVPIITFNSAIRRVLIYYNLKPTEAYKVDGNHVYFSPTDMHSIEVFEGGNSINSILNSEKALPVDLKIGDIILEGDNISFENTTEYFRNFMRALLEQ